MNALEAKAKVNYTGLPPLITEDNCEDLTIRAKLWRLDQDTWVLATTRTDDGVWSGGSCELPSVNFSGSTLRVMVTGDND